VLNPPAADAALAQLPLPFHDHLAVVDRDPQVLAARLAQHYTLLDFGPRDAAEGDFLHRSSTAAAGDLLLTCGYTSPIQGRIGERPGVGSINLCFAGRSRYECGGRDLEILPEQPLYFSPGWEYSYTVDHFNGMAFHVDLQRLRATAAAMAGLGVSERRFSSDLDQPRVLCRSTPRIGGLLELLRREFALLDGCPALPIGYWAHLPVDDLIYRTLTLLLFPRLARLLEQPELTPSIGRERVLAELVEWMDANLHRPLGLTELERRSGYSRHSLQLAFQQRFSCGPIQWIRQQRLERALALCRQRAPRLRALAANLQAAATNLRALNAERYGPSPAPQPPDERTESRFRREDQELDQQRYNDAYDQWQQVEQQRRWAWEQRQVSRRRAARERLEQAARALRALQPNLFRSPRSLELDRALVERLSHCRTGELAPSPATPTTAAAQP